MAAFNVRAPGFEKLKKSGDCNIDLFLPKFWNGLMDCKFEFKFTDIKVPTGTFAILQPQDQDIGKICIIHKRLATDFETKKKGSFLFSPSHSFVRLSMLQIKKKEVACKLSACSNSSCSSLLIIDPERSPPPLFAINL